MPFAIDSTPWAAALDPGLVLMVFLLSLRLAAVLMMTPLLHAASVPAPVRVLIIVALAVAMAPGLPPDAGREAQGWEMGRLLAACLTELALGATMGLSILAAFAAISMAGRLIDVQIGFGMAQVFDPASQTQVPVLTSAFNQFGVMAFFLADGHHALMRGLAFSLERFPLGGTWALAATAPAVVRQAGALFGLGFALAAPVVVALLLVELAVAVVARNLPQMNMFVIGIPLKMVVGIAALSLWFGGLGGFMPRIYGSIYQTWDAGFSAAAAPAGAR